jgi:hypothetical protein
MVPSTICCDLLAAYSFVKSGLLFVLKNVNACQKYLDLMRVIIYFRLVFMRFYTILKIGHSILGVELLSKAEN